MRPAEQTASFLEWVTPLVTSFDLAIARWEGGSRTFIGPVAFRTEAIDIQAVQKRLAHLRAENARGADIYWRPHRYCSWPLVFLDDVPHETALNIAKKYGAAVIETSQGSCHVWITCEAELEEFERYEAQAYLIEQLQGKADPGSVSGDHWGRLPGFKNQKPTRQNWVNLVTTTENARWDPYTTSKASQEGQAKRKRTSSEGQGPDMSRSEWGFVMGSLEYGVPPFKILEKLIEHASPRRGRDDATRYATYTVKKACRIKGIPF